MAGSVQLTKSDKIGTIEFYHPKGNSLPELVLEQLADTISRAGRNHDIRILILKSAGEGAFCAGASFDELAAITTEEEGRKFFWGFAKVILAMKTCPKFIIVRVHGKTVGGGVGIAASGDYTFANSAAAIKLSELSLGIGPFVIEPVVKRRIGQSALATLAIDAANWQSAKWAYQSGLYNKLLSTTAELDAHIAVFSEQLAAYSPEAMREMKSMFWEGTEHFESLMEKRAGISGKLVLGSYTKNFIRKFNSR